MIDIQVELIGRGDTGDTAAITGILESWEAQDVGGSAVLVERDPEVQVLACVPWDWSGAAPAGVWAVLALALRLSGERPGTTWTVRDEALGDRSVVAEEILRARGMPGDTLHLRGGWLTDLDGVRPGVWRPLTCDLLAEIEAMTRLCGWIGVDPDEVIAHARRRVADTVRAAFSDMRYPGDAAIDCFWPETTAYFRGRHWNGHAVEDLRMYADALFYLPPAGFVFFLPSFVLADLEDPEAADGLGGQVAFQLGDEVGAERVARLSPAQRDALVTFLDFLAGTGHSDVEPALRRLASADERGRRAP